MGGSLFEFSRPPTAEDLRPAEDRAERCPVCGYPTRELFGPVGHTPKCWACLMDLRQWCDPIEGEPVWPVAAVSWFAYESWCERYTLAAAEHKQGTWFLLSPGYPRWREFPTLAATMDWMKERWPLAYPNVELLRKGDEIYGHRTCARPGDPDYEWPDALDRALSWAETCPFGTRPDPEPGDEPGPGPSLEEYVW
jgi:hypothetical protein